MTINSENQKIRDAELIVETAISLSEVTAGKSVRLWHKFQASLMFSRMILTYISILHYTPGSSFFGPIREFHIWDLSTQASLARNLIETYLTLFYLTIERVDRDELELRKLLWSYHETSEKIKMLEAAIPDSTNIIHLKASRKIDEDRISSNVAFAKISAAKQKNLLQKDQCKTKSNTEICKSAGISEKYFRSIFKYLSNFTHSSPLSISQMDALRKFDPEALHVFLHVLNISTGFMAVAMGDFRKLNSKMRFKFDSNILRTIRIWRGVHKWDLPSVSRRAEQAAPNERKGKGISPRIFVLEHGIATKRSEDIKD